MTRAALAGLGAMLAVAAVGPAVAASPVATIELDPCVADPERVRRAIELELDSIEGATATTRVSIDCDGELRIVSAQDARTDRRVKRTVSLAGQPATTHVRVIALAAAELVAASARERVGPAPPSMAVALAPAPIPVVRVPAAAPGPAPARPRDRARWSLGALVGARAIGELGTRGVALGLGVAGGTLRLGVDVGVEHGTSSTTELRKLLVSSASVGMRAGAGASWRGVALEVTAGLRLGVVHLTGDSLAPSAMWMSDIDPWMAPALGFGARTAGDGIGVEVGVELGWIVKPVHPATTHDDTVWSGPFAAPRVAIAARW